MGNGVPHSSADQSPLGASPLRRKDVETVLEIKRLLYQQGFTIEGARKQLASDSRSEVPAKQKHLFGSTLDRGEVKGIKRELQSILTILSRKC